MTLENELQRADAPDTNEMQRTDAPDADERALGDNNGTPPLIVQNSSLREMPVATVPRSTFNAAVIAFVCLLVGGVVGWVGRDRLAQTNDVENETLINEAVAAAVAALPAGSVVAAEPTRDPNQRFVVDIKDNPSLGPEDAPITIIEFGDFRCSYCRRFNDETLQQILTNYEGQVRFVFRDYPILGPDSIEAALAGECAHDQDAFWPFHDWLYANQDRLNREGFLEGATAVEMDIETFTACLDARTHEEEVIADYLDGETLGVSGTPTFFINGKLLTGAQPYMVFAGVLEQELAAIEQPAAS
jgi:protein-disulfide isomerase